MAQNSKNWTKSKAPAGSKGGKSFAAFIAKKKKKG